MFRTNRGFTIVELLIVIVVIAILAAISIVAYNGIQERARASSVASSLTQIEKGLRMMAIDQGRSTWWHENDISSSTGNKPLRQVMEQTTLDNYVQDYADDVGTGWYYDNDGDASGACGTSHMGAQIQIRGIARDDLIQAVDDAIDDGDMGCGKVRILSSGTLLYRISYDQSI